MSKYWTYLIYQVVWQGAIWGATYHAVFILNQSGWWFAFALLLSGSAYKPEIWIHGIEDKEVDAVEDKL